MAGISSFHFPSTIQVPVNGDTKVELDEVLSVVLENIQASGRDVRFKELVVGGTTYIDNSEHLSIENDDIGRVYFDNTSYESFEEAGEIVFRLILDSDVDVPVTVGVATSGGTASSAEGDYSAIVADVVFAGSAREEILVHVPVNDEPLVELDEDFVLYIGNVNASDRNVIPGSPSRAGAHFRGFGVAR